MKIDDSEYGVWVGFEPLRERKGKRTVGWRKVRKMKQRCDFQELCSQKSRELIRVPCSVPAHL